MTAFANHFAFEFKTGLRNPSLLFINYLFPLLFYAMMGVVMTAINPTFKESMLPAMVVFTIMASTLLGLPNPLVESRAAGIYRSFKINGVPAISILAIPVLTTVFHALIASTLVALTAAPLFNGVPPLDWLNFCLITTLTAFTCGAIGALIGVASNDTRATVLWSQLIFLPSMLLGGLMLPLSLLPESIRPFSLLLPTAHAMQGYLGLAYNQPTVFNPIASVAVLLTSGLLAFGLAIYLFSWDTQNSVRRGHPLMALLAIVPYLAAIFIK
ncbi:MAG: ABC transporter permease [Chloroflexota bacterium]|nr:ABC transporter permease [Chloroflexota bacterium]